MAFVKIDREFFNNPFWSEERTYSKAEAWLDLMQLARFEASTELINSKAIELEIGEIPVSLRFLEKRWNWGNTKVRNYIKLLNKLNLTTQRTTQGQTILKVNNSKGSEGENKIKQQGNNTQNNTSATHQQHTNNTNIKNIRRKELKKNTSMGDKKSYRFSPPTLPEVQNYFYSKTEDFDFSKLEGEKFHDHYESNGWMVGKNKMKKWKNAVSGWISRTKRFEKEKSSAKKEKENENKIGRQTIDEIKANANRSTWFE